MRVLSLVTILLFPLAVNAQTPVDLTVDVAKCTLTYHLVHKLHKIDGVSRKVEGRARLLPDGRAQVAVRTPVESFDSGNVNRDAHMKEAVEAARFPVVELKVLIEGLSAPSKFPTSVDRTVKAQLTFHGVQQTLDLPVKIVWESASRVHATGRITVSLDAFKIERPSLMFVKVDDALGVDADLVFTR